MLTPHKIYIAEWKVPIIRKLRLFLGDIGCQPIGLSKMTNVDDVNDGNNDENGKNSYTTDNHSEGEEDKV